tara:strand:- start:762 stop:947 length:186 start_codon:yes stop_codon:yes gene_type:complete
MRLLELQNVEALLAMPFMPLLTAEHKARIIKNLEAVETRSTLEDARKRTAIYKLTKLSTNG